MSALSFLVTSGGVSAGASTPYQMPTSNPGNPDSATVGSWGTSGERLVLVTASSRSRPLSENGLAVIAEGNIISIRPLTRSGMAAEVPL